MPMGFRSKEKFSAEIPVTAVLYKGSSAIFRQRGLSSAMLRLGQASPCPSFPPSFFCNTMSDTVLHTGAGVVVFIEF